MVREQDARDCRSRIEKIEKGVCKGARDARGAVVVGGETEGERIDGMEVKSISSARQRLPGPKGLGEKGRVAQWQSTAESRAPRPQGALGKDLLKEGATRSYFRPLAQSSQSPAGLKANPKPKVGPGWAQQSAIGGGNCDGAFAAVGVKRSYSPSACGSVLLDLHACISLSCFSFMLCPLEPPPLVLRLSSLSYAIVGGEMVEFLVLLVIQSHPAITLLPLTLHVVT